MTSNVLEAAALKGHDFSRAERGARTDWALQAAEKLDWAVGRGFIPGIKSAGSTGALAPEVCPSQCSVEDRPFSASCLAPEGCSLVIANRPRTFSETFEARPRRFGRTSSLSIRAACLALLFLAPLSLPAQDVTLHVDVKLVNIFVNVTDRNGAIVGGLTRDDFAVTEDGRQQAISVFERQSELPLNLTLAIDTSGSVRKDLTEEADAARRFVRAILRPQDQMSLLQFATDVRELTPFTNKVAMIDRGLNQLHSDYATALYDAIVLGSEQLGPKDGRRVLILVSDGDDTAKSSTYDQALEAALRHEVMIYSIIDVPIEASAGRDLGGEHALITLAEQTGGKSFYVEAGGLDKAFAQVSDDLRTQYLIGYYPHNQEPGRTFHRIDVTVPRAAVQNFNVRHKTGYYGDKPATKN
jgi:Ca-activated chloride channel family protein